MNNAIFAPFVKRALSTKLSTFDSPISLYYNLSIVALHIKNKEVKKGGDKMKAHSGQKDKIPHGLIRIKFPMPLQCCNSVLAIEYGSFEKPLKRKKLLKIMRQNMTMVAEYKNMPVGFLIYTINDTNVRILRMAVAKNMRRKGIGFKMLAELMSRSAVETRKVVTLYVRETNLPAQLFYRNWGFEAVEIFPDYYKDTGESAYLMLYRDNSLLHDPLAI